MLRTLLLVAVVTLSGCSSESTSDPEPSAGAFSAEVRENFLASCVENAAATAGDSVDEPQLEATCQCILGKVEQEYDEVEFAAFEQRLLDETASEDESSRLEQWSTECAEENAA